MGYIKIKKQNKKTKRYVLKRLTLIFMSLMDFYNHKKYLSNVT